MNKLGYILEVPSNSGYPPGYTLKSLKEQILTLKRYFKKLGAKEALRFAEEVVPTLSLPLGAEGWFAIPRVEAFSPVYHHAVMKMHQKLSAPRQFSDYELRGITRGHLLPYARTGSALRAVGTKQTGNILIIPAQFGKRHAGRSVCAVHRHMHHDEYGLGAFAVGAMLLTHPERLVGHDELRIDCPGDGYVDDPQRVASKSPFYNRHAQTLRYGVFNQKPAVIGSLSFYGSVTGFNVVWPESS